SSLDSPASTTSRTGADRCGPARKMYFESSGPKPPHTMDADQAFADVSIDSVRTFWNARPCNIRHSAKEVGSREYFDEVERRKYFVEPHIQAFAEFDRWRGKKVLEIGCGLGTDTVSFARAGAQVTAIELSEASADLARRRLEVFGL